MILTYNIVRNLNRRRHMIQTHIVKETNVSILFFNFYCLFILYYYLGNSSILNQIIVLRNGNRDFIKCAIYHNI